MNIYTQVVTIAAVIAFLFNKASSKQTSERLRVKGSSVSERFKTLTRNPDVRGSSPLSAGTLV